MTTHPNSRQTRRGRYARRRNLRGPLAVVAATLAVLVLLLASCAETGTVADEEPVPVPTAVQDPEGPPTTEPVADPDWYSGDDELDALYLNCDDGDMEACDELFLAAPLGSHHEEFGDTCGGRQPAGTDVWCSNEYDTDVFALSVELTFSEMSAAEAAEICDAVDLLGMELAIDLHRSGYTEDGTQWRPEYDDILADAIEELCA